MIVRATLVTSLFVLGAFACNREGHQDLEKQANAVSSRAHEGTVSQAAARVDSEKEPSVNDKVVKTEAEWKRELTPDGFRVMREKGTEMAFTGKYNSLKDKGTFRCAACGLELFSSADKFDSGTGWPSFTAPAAENHVRNISDSSHGMVRVEVVCNRCDAHLGHVFDDGPAPTNLRYCINSVALEFEKSELAKK